MALTELKKGSRYQVRQDSRGNGKFQYTSHWRKDGDPSKEYVKDGIFEVVEVDSAGDYKGYVIDTSTGKRMRDTPSYVAKVEAKFFEEASSTPSAPELPTGVPQPVAQAANALQLPLMDATAASQGLATMFASLLMGAIKSPDVEKMVMDAVKEVATQKIPRPMEVKFQESSVVIDNVHNKFTTVLERLKTTKNIMLVGPAGCGKSHLAEQVAESLGLDYSSVSCSSDMSSSVLTGWLLPSDGGKFEYAPSDFINLYENGGVFLLDEMDAADPSILLIINQALANGRITIPQRKGNTVVKRHPNFIAVAATNTFGRGGNLMYSRERLDESTIDRSRSGMIELDYDPELEAKLVDPEVLEWGLAVRERIINARLKRVISTRFLRDASALKEHAGYSLKQIKEIFFGDFKQDERVKIDL